MPDLLRLNTLVIRYLIPTIPFYRGEEGYRWPAFLIITFLTLGVLVLSRDVTGQSSPLLGGIDVGLFSPVFARSLMFTVDCFGFFAFTLMSGGLRSSPFTTALFALPALAIFLPEPFPHVTAYTVLICTFTLLSSGGSSNRRRELPEGRLAFGIVTVAILVLTTCVAFVTRPQ